jgi:ATP-dependent Clp protease adaptor protein ClpS
MIKVNEKIDEELKAIFSGNIPWITIVWDDPVNLMTYVTYVLMELLDLVKKKQTKS